MFIKQIDDNVIIIISYYQMQNIYERMTHNIIITQDTRILYPDNNA